jgi:hypothetical protein
LAAAFAISLAGFQAIQQTAGSSDDVFAAPAEKVEVCHATGNGGFVIISTKALTDLGAVGHLDENGNPEQGHEQDVLAEDGHCPDHHD